MTELSANTNSAKVASDRGLPEGCKRDKSDLIYQAATIAAAMLLILSAAA